MRLVGVLLGAAVLLGLAPAADPQSDPAGKPKYTIDGKADDWKGVKPVWEEAGTTGNHWKSGVDVKQVYFDNDDRYLYALLKLKPSLPEFFGKDKTSAESGSVGSFFFDTDCDPATGSKRLSATAFGAFVEDAGNDPKYAKYAKYVGYDRELRINIGFTLENPQSKETLKVTKWIEYRAFKLDAQGAFKDEEKGCQASTQEKGQPLAFDADGLELAIPLKCLGLTPGQKVRVLFNESANWGRVEALSYAELTLKK